MADEDPFEDEEEDQAAEEAPAEEKAPPPAPKPPQAALEERPGVSLEQAERMAEMLAKVARALPVRQYRYQLKRWAKEWTRAATMVAGEGDELTIELIGSLTMGMRLPCKNKRGEPDIGVVVRVMSRDNQWSVHLVPENDDRDVYENYSHPASPVVVYA